MFYCDKYKKQLKFVISSYKWIDNFKNSKILITGASGLIGSSIADILLYLNKNLKLNIQLYLCGRNKERISDRFSIYQEGIDFIYFHFDATGLFNFTEKLDYIIHCASNSDPLMISKEPVETLICNINGVYQLLNFCKNKSTRMVYVSSSEVYGNKTSNESFTEDEYGFFDFLNPRASYPSGKRAAETLCSSFNNEYDTNCVIVRPGHIYGPQFLSNDSHASTQFFKKVLENSDIIMKSNGLQLRSYCFSLDCATAILYILLNGEKSHAYNISNSKSICTIREFAETICKLSGKKILFEDSSENEKKSYNFMKNSSLNSSKLEKLGWNGIYNLEEGIKVTLEILNEKNEN